MEALSLQAVLVVILCLQSTDAACPTHCKAGQTCNSADSGCAECEQAYYGRQCQHRMQCRHTDKGAEYRGTIDESESGKTCQRWDVDTPHKHPNNDIFKDEENYCRNVPDNLEPEPWCYTTDPDTRWELCDIPKCDTQCLAPNLDVPFIDITNPPDDGFVVGFTADIKVVCGPGYELQGGSMTATTTTRCQSDKTWSLTTLPSCNKIQCLSPPPPPANSKVGKEQDKYEYQDKITIVCDIGYTLHGNGEITCQADKTWSSTSASCKKIQCQVPSPPGNSKIGKEQDKYEYQDIITFVCNVGYTLDGNNEMTCQSNKTWSTASGSCKKVQCTSPTLPHNSKIGNPQPKYEYQDTITIVCDTGYTLQGTKEMTCQSDKMWSSTSAICNRVRCQSPALPDNSTLENPKDYYEYEDKITFVCNRGYILQGNNEMICNADKSWSSASGSCKTLCPSNCKPEQICVSEDNGCSDCEKAYYGRQCQHRMQCRYTVKGLEYRGTKNKTKSGITCQHWALDDPHEHTNNEKFKDEENYCRIPETSPDPGPWCYTMDPNVKDEVCDIPMCDSECLAPRLDAPYVDINNPPTDGFTVGFTAVIDVGCGTGYESNGQVRTTCQSNKAWSLITLPICKKIQCSMSLLPSNSRIINEMDKYEYEDIITIGCNTGYTLEGKDTLVCLANKSWSHPSTTCKINECPAPGLNARSNVTEPKSVYVYKDLIKIVCATGYVAKGSAQLTCQADRTWDVEPPICEKIEETSNVGAIVGGTVGGILGIAVVVIVIVFLWKRRKSLEKQKDSAQFNALEDIKNIETEESGHNVYANIGAAKASVEKEEAGPSSADDTYCNIQEAKNIVKIKIENLRQYLKDKKSDLHFFEEEFKTFPVGLQRPAQAAMKPKNRPKNKYKNIYPYDDNRIMLTLQKGVADSDFINASPIKGYSGKTKYIAAQGPQDATHVDFWRMIHEQRIRNIVMLTNAFEGGVKKCIQYWLDEEIYQAGAITVELQSSDKFADYTIRRLKIIKDDDITFVHQHHFTTWPDKGVPKCPSVLAQFHKKVFDMPGQDDIPIVVHCSAGIGRTGTFIALDYLLDEAKKTGSVGVSTALETLREQRVNMVQTKEQYAFLHDVVVDALELRTSVVKAADFSDKYKRLLVRNKTTGKFLLQEEFETVNESTSYLKADACTVGKREENKPKNRYNNILPTDDNRVHLSGATEDESYINAVYLPGYRNGYAYIITQAPLSNTIEDFWKLIFDEKIASIVALNQNTNEHEMYWPIDKGKLREYGDFKISLIGKEEDVGFQCLTFQVSHQKAKHVVKQFQIHFWPDTDTVPSTTAPMLKLMDNVQMQQIETTPILVHCMNGADKSGLFCTAMALLDKLKGDQEVAVQALVKQMKSIRPQIIPKLEQYQYCYTLLGMYIESFETYSNFS